MIETNDFRVGTAFEMDGKLMTIVTVEHIKLARAGAVIKAKLRNIRDGSMFEHSFRSGDKFKVVRIEKTEASYLYSEGDFLHFMDSSTYEQVADLLWQSAPGHWVPAGDLGRAAGQYISFQFELSQYVVRTGAFIAGLQ